MDMIRSSHIDPVALEEHVNSRLQSAISVANDVAQTQARAVAEAHAVEHAHISDVRFTERFKQLENQLQARLDQRMREVLTAHIEQVEAEISLAITKQGREIMKLMEKQLNEFQKQVTVQLEESKSCAVKKAKTAIRRHHAEESRARNAITESSQHEWQRSAIASAALRAEEILQTFVSKQNVWSQAPIGNAISSAIELCSTTTNAATIEITKGESDSSSDENLEAPKMKKCIAGHLNDYFHGQR